MLRCIALLVVIFILMNPGESALGAEPGSGVIEGNVINKTENGTNVADLNVTLKTYLDDAEAGSATAMTDAGGRFVFDGLSTAPGYSYQAVVAFQGAEYRSMLLSFNQEETVRSARVMVYDSTTSDAIIMVEISRTVLYLEQDGLLVKEYMLFINGTDRTYIGTRETTAEGAIETLRFFLPKNAGELQLETGLMKSYAYINEDGFSDTMPLFPGVREVAYSYKIDFSTEAYEFVKKVNYPIATYNFLAQEKGIEIVSDQLTIEEPIIMKATRFNRLSGKDLASGDIIVIQLIEIPQTIQWAVIVIWVALGLIVLVGGLIFIYWMKKVRVKPVKPERKLPRKGHNKVSRV